MGGVQDKGYVPMIREKPNVIKNRNNPLTKEEIGNIFVGRMRAMKKEGS